MSGDDRVLALSMRPRSFSELVGQETLIETLKTQWHSGRIPHFFIIAGPIGVGKTTLARLISLSLQCPDHHDPFEDPSSLPWNKYSRYDIREINAGNKNGIDDVRALIEQMHYLPLAPSKAKVVIMDEAHQLTNAAQNALLTETEDVKKHVYFIFCTSQVSKLLPALRRRAYIVTPKLLDEPDTVYLLGAAIKRSGSSLPIDPLLEAISLHDIRTPGLVLQAAERYFSGQSAIESVSSTATNPSLDTMAVCRALTKGDWPTAAAQLAHASKQDVFALRACIAGYWKTMLLKSSGAKAVNVAQAISALTNASSADDSCALPSFLAAACVASRRLQGSG